MTFRTLLLGVVCTFTACAPAPDAGEPLRGSTTAQLPLRDLEVSYTDAAEIPSQLPFYQRATGISGNLSSAGSDTLANMVTLWGEAFGRIYPAVNIQVQAAGSSSAPPALTEGTVNFGTMSRALTDVENESFEARHGYKPLAVRVAIDAVAIYVHKDNPLQSINLEDLDSVYSVTRRCGGRRDLTAWGDLGLDGRWHNQPIQIFGRNSVSGTYGFFKTFALCSGDYKNSLNEQPGSASVVQSVASSLNGIGYSGIGNSTSGVKTLALQTGRNTTISANTATVTDGSYPLTRYFYIYLNKRPGHALNPLEQEFLSFVLSKDGQEIVSKDGYIPIPPQLAAREMRKLQS
ncbi:MAG: phosphate ABC transporter substrate-binding protein PstS family protein [Pseudomonadota bacterium]